jgi:hypothetical protein
LSDFCLLAFPDGSHKSFARLAVWTGDTLSCLDQPLVILFVQPGQQSAIFGNTFEDLDSLQQCVIGWSVANGRIFRIFHGSVSRSCASLKRKV